MEWTWELCDLNQNLIHRLDDRRPGSEVTLGVNVGRSARVSLSKEDDAYADIDLMETTLRVTIDGWTDPVFTGRVLLPDATESAESEGVTLNAIDSLGMLERAFVHKAPEAIFATTGILVLGYSSVDQGQIMWNLIDHAQDNGIDAGVQDGSRPASVTRTRFYPTGKQIAEAIVQLSEVNNGPDFEFQPIEAGGGILSEFNTYYPKQGSDLTSDVIFRTGQGTSDDTARILNTQDSGEQLRNRAIIIGSIANLNTFGIISIADHAASQAIYGVLEYFEVRSDITTFTGLEDYSVGVVRAAAMPTEFIDFTVSLDGPSFGPGADGAYYLGDTVALDVYPRQGGDAEQISGRVLDAVLSDDEAGNVTVRHSCAPESVAEGAISEDHYYVQLMEGEETVPE